MYVTVGSLGIPSSGVWVLMNRRCVWASRSANTSVRPRVTMSIHGESVSNGSGSSGSCSMSRAQIICVHVVPHFGGVLMMMSPGRSSKPSQRLLSYILAQLRVSLPGCSGDVGSDDIGRVPVQRCPSPVVAHGGAWVGARRGFLHVAKRDAGVERGGDE